MKPGAPGDCSGKAQAIFYWAGLVVGRCTAADMADGKCGWKGKFISFSDAPACSLVFFTFKATRVNGHTGILIYATEKNENQMANASQKQNRFVLSVIKKDGDDGYYNHLEHTKELD